MKILSSGHPLVKNSIFQGCCTSPAKCALIIVGIIAYVMTNRLPNNVFLRLVSLCKSYRHPERMRLPDTSE